MQNYIKDLSGSVFLVLVLLFGCSTTPMMTSPKVLESGEYRISPGLSLATMGRESFMVVYPAPNLQGRLGIATNVDLGLTLAGPRASLDGRYQLVDGDRLVLAMGPDVFFGLGSSRSVGSPGFSPALEVGLTTSVGWKIAPGIVFVMLRPHWAEFPGSISDDFKSTLGTGMAFDLSPVFQIIPEFLVTTVLFEDLEPVAIDAYGDKNSYDFQFGITLAITL